MKTHALKTWPFFFAAVVSGEKPFEVRRDDREFQVGESLRLEEWDPKDQQYTGRFVERRITYKISGPAFGIEAGHCVLGLAA